MLSRRDLLGGAGAAAMLAPGAGMGGGGPAGLGTGYGASFPTGNGPVVDAYPEDETALLGRLVRRFEDSEMASTDARLLGEKCRDYYDGRQYTPEEMSILKARKQPPVINNYIKRKVDLLRGMERRGRSDPKAFPRDPHEDTRADAATQALRYVADDQRYDVVRSSMYDNLLIEGFGGVEVIVERDELDGSWHIVTNHIPWERLFFDPHSAHPGFTDATYLGVVIWMDRDDALDRWEGAEDVLSATTEAVSSNTYDDKPQHRWVDRGRQRVRVVQMYWKKRNDWWTATFTKGGFLEAPQKSPYVDRHGNATCPIILRSAYTDRDLNRYGVVKDLISIQDSINKRESKLMHSLSVNQILAEQGAFADVEKARREAARPDGVIIYNKDFQFKLQKDQAEIQGQFNLLQHAVQQMNVTGPNASMAGKDPREQSGRAIIAQQAGGAVESEPLADALRQHTHKVFEAIWMRIKQFWTDEKWIRVTDDDKNVKFVGLNHPVTLQEELQGMDPEQAQQMAQQMGLQPGDPRLQQVIRVENNINDMDVDITVEEGPDNPTMAAEQYQQIMQLPPMVLQNFPPSFFIQASSLRNKDQLLKLLEEHQKQTAAGQQQAQQAAQAMQEAQVGKARAEVGKVEADTADKRAQAMERMHGIAADHAAMAHQPVVPGVGPIAPEHNPLLQPEPVPPGPGGDAGPAAPGPGPAPMPSLPDPSMMPPHVNPLMPHPPMGA